MENPEVFKDLIKKEKIEAESVVSQPTIIKKLKGTLENVYKSKTARAISLMVALGIGVEFWPHKNEGKTTLPKKPEIASTSTGFENISPKFSTELEITNSDNRYILHLGQIHSADSLEKTKEKIDLNIVIENQKDQEDLILNLKDKYKIDQFYIEGVLPDFLAVMESLKKQLSEIEKQEGIEAMRYRVIELVHGVQDFDMSDQHKAWLLEILENKLEPLVSPDDQFFIKLKNNSLISGDNKYLWGAAMKLYSEGKINLISAESLEANSETFKPYTFIEKLQNKEEVFLIRNKIREEKAVRIITSDFGFSNSKIIAMVYGEGHDFKSSVETYNQKNHNKNIGLVKFKHK